MRNSACSNLSLKTLFTAGEDITIVKEKYEAESNYFSYIYDNVTVICQFIYLLKVATIL